MKWSSQSHEFFWIKARPVPDASIPHSFCRYQECMALWVSCTIEELNAQCLQGPVAFLHPQINIKISDIRAEYFPGLLYIRRCLQGDAALRMPGEFSDIAIGWH